MHRPSARLLLPALIALSALATSCAKDDPEPPTASGPYTLRVAHVVDGLPLTYDTLLYTNEAGATFSVSRVEYYLSELVLIGSGGTPNDTLHGPWYVNAAGTTDFDLGSLPAGTYSSATMLLGLPPELNLTDSLPNTIENINMAWPVPMGGGYHFIKFEGHFLADSVPYGFAMHIGRDAFLPHCEMPQGFTISGGGGKLLLTFNLNEVFRSPHTYDLAAGNYSMGDMVLMGQLRDNCTNAFTIASQP